ncbi:hypothetical protein [Pseudoneobacillus sp. C159]
MKTGEKKTYFYIPLLGFIEVADTLEETIKRMHELEVKKELKDKKILRSLKRAYPGKFIKKCGEAWQISDNPIE